MMLAWERTDVFEALVKSETADQSALVASAAPEITAVDLVDLGVLILKA
ncbi:hypothetical protein QN239_32355 [Mycolicibacterium sp. Y3]